VAAWAEVAGLAAEGQQILGGAVRTPDAREARLQHAAVQIPAHHRVHNAAPATVLVFEHVLVLAAEVIEVIREEPVQR